MKKMKNLLIIAGIVLLSLSFSNCEKDEPIEIQEEYCWRCEIRGPTNDRVLETISICGATSEDIQKISEHRRTLLYTHPSLPEGRSLIRFNCKKLN